MFPMHSLLRTYCFYWSNMSISGDCEDLGAKGDLVEDLKDEEKALS
jgi:hypothetical protein